MLLDLQIVESKIRKCSLQVVREVRGNQYLVDNFEAEKP